MYAIVRTGGKQYRVAEKKVVRLELLDAQVGSQVELGDVAMLGGGPHALVGAPNVDGARVLGRVVAEGRTRRIVVYKFKPKKGYHRRRGHRQSFHDVLIEQVLGPGESPRVAVATSASPAEDAGETPRDLAAEAAL